MICPCCNHPVLDNATFLARQLMLSKQLTKIFLALEHAGEVGINTRRLTNILYDDVLDPPLTANNVVHVQMSTLNKKLAAVGLHITGGMKGERNYRLEEIDDHASRSIKEAMRQFRGRPGEAVQVAPAKHHARREWDRVRSSRPS